MTLRVSRIEEVEGLHAIESAWSELAAARVSGLFLGPRWQLAWWHSYHRQLAGALWSLVVTDGNDVVGLLPLYRRVARRNPGTRVTEVRLLGDAGPRPLGLDLLVAEGYEQAVGVALAEELVEQSADWDVLDLQPLRDPSVGRAFLAQRLTALHRHVDSIEAGGGSCLQLSVLDSAETHSIARHRIYTGDAAQLRKGLAALRRLSRLEWASGEEASPLVDREATHLLEDFIIPLGLDGRARLARLDDVDGEAGAVALVVDDGPRAIMLALAVDPERSHLAESLIEAEAVASRNRGIDALEVGIGANEHALPSLPSSRLRAIRLRAYGTSTAAALARTYGAVRKSVEVAKDAPGAAAAGARAAWTKIRTAAAHVAGYERMHLYRGELWTRELAQPPGLVLSLFTEADFTELEAAEVGTLLESLDLDKERAQVAWRRGDLAVLARLNDKPAGIAWCARNPVEVPELEREFRVGAGEAYIHDLFVAPQARGRSVAPLMLECLARELRQRDVYRSWALIGTDNIASVRAFEKAAYAAVCDVVYARMAVTDRIFVRPPDSEAKKRLGL